MSEEQNVKKMILKTALEIIEESGFENLTVRKIVEKSGKNLNAINYYYGSKENLEVEAVKYFFDKIYGEFFNNDKDSYTMEEFLNVYCNMLLENRNLFKKIFSILISEKKEIIETVSKYVNKKISEAAKKIKDEKIDIEEDRMKYFQKMAAVIYPVLIVDGVENMFGFNLREEETRKKYIKILLKNKE